MLLACHHDVVQAFPAYRADQALRIPVLPGRTCRSRMITSAKRANSADEYIAATLRGVFHSTQAPEVTGTAGRPHAPLATGSWSLDAVRPTYQWYAGSQPIAGATGAAYQPTPPRPGCHPRGRTATSPGYAEQTARSSETAGPARPCRRGQADRSGKAVLGARSGPTRVDAAVDATRTSAGTADQEPIRGAHDSTYTLRPATSAIGSTCEVTVQRGTGCRSPGGRSAPQGPHCPGLTAHHDPARPGLPVADPSSPPASGTHPARRASGTATAARRSVRGRRRRGSRLLAPMRAGTHKLTVVYHGGALEKVGRITVPVTVP